MKTIHKYPLPVSTRQTLHLPEGATILHAGLDPTNRLCLWAGVDTSKARESRTFAIVGTGHDVPDGLTFIGSVIQGDFVWHIFEEIK